MQVPFFKFNQNFLKNKKNYIRLFENVMSSGNYILGSNVNNFEKKLKKYLDVERCITVSNGTDALEIVLRLLNISFGDEVIVPAYSWISTASCVKIVGAKPVFCDIVI